MTGIVGFASVVGDVADTAAVIELAVDASREAIAQVDGDYRPYALWFVSDPSLDPSRTMAATLHQRLGLASFAGAYDMLGNARSTVGALKIASTSTMMAVVLEGSVVTAFCFGKGVPLADEIAGGTITDAADASGIRAARQALAATLSSASLADEDLAVVCVSGAGATDVATTLAIDPSRLLVGVGTAQLFSDALSMVPPGSVVAQVVGCDGADVRLWRVASNVDAAPV